MTYAALAYLGITSLFGSWVLVDRLFDSLTARAHRRGVEQGYLPGER